MSWIFSIGACSASRARTPVLWITRRVVTTNSSAEARLGREAFPQEPERRGGEQEGERRPVEDPVVAGPVHDRLSRGEVLLRVGHWARPSKGNIPVRTHRNLCPQDK